MFLPRPRSFLTLILLGLAVITLPLGIALVNASLGVGEMAEDSRRSLYKAVVVTHNGQSLARHIVTLERHARQYQILDDPNLLTRYEAERKAFTTTLQRLSDLGLHSEHSKIIDALTLNEEILYHSLQSHPVSSDDTEAIVMGFTLLSELVQDLLHTNYTIIDTQANAMAIAADRSRQQLWLQVLAVIPFTFIVAAWFTYLITRPISQINEAIRQLGDGNVNDAISIQGPQDIRLIGERLNWLRRRLRDVEREKARFLQHVSHDLKTPLTAIREGSELLHDQIVGPLEPAQLEVTEILQVSGMRLQRQIENLLNYNSAYARNPALKLVEIRIPALLERLIGDHRLAMLGKGITTESKIDPITLFADRERLSVIIDNLLSNSVKFSPTAGIITIQVKLNEDQVCFEIRNQGPWIPENDQERIFDTFYQGSTEETTSVSGSGLGLSIAEDYVLAHRGTISCHNLDGGGVSFIVSLPQGQKPV